MGMWLLSHFSFRALYFLSDFNFFVVYHIFRYRRKVTAQNLRRSFPDKSEEWLKKTERRFYHYICDYMLEDIKMLNLTLPELEKRMKYVNITLFLEMLEKYGGIILLIPHYANFEWIIGMGSIMNSGDVPVQVYKPLHDPYLDRLLQRIRSRFGGYNVPKHSTVRGIIKLKREGKKMAIGLITDQSPSPADAVYWTHFLHQDTAFMDGAEKIARLMGYPVFYCELTKSGRGHCEVDFQLVTEFPQRTLPGEITEQFARRLEQTIIREPAYWFWSHKRWKRGPEDYVKQKHG